jgi:hypothetical protein
MKNFHENVKSNLLLVMLVLLLPATISAQVERSKTVKKDFTGVKELQVSHRYGPLMVKKSTDGKVKMDAVLTVKAKKEEDVEIVLEHFDIKINQSGDRLMLETNFSVENWNTRNGITGIRFEDGEKVKNLKDIDVRFVLSVPSLKKLNLGNKYDDIEIEEGIQANVFIKQYSGRIKAGNIKGDLSMDAKYTKARFGNFKNGKLELYDCEMVFGSGNDVNIKSKYSELKLGALNSLQLDTYDDKVETGDINRNLTIQDKYSNFKIGSFAEARMDIYDADLDLYGGDQMMVKSKYSSIRLTQLNFLQFQVSYDDQLEAKQLGKLQVDNSKYTKYDLGTLQKGLTIKSYDDNIDIEKLVGPLDDITIDGKYTNVDFNMGSGVAFALKADMKYGKLNIDDNKFDTQIYKEKNSNIEFNGRTKGAPADAPVITINCYDCNIDW